MRFLKPYKQVAQQQKASAKCSSQFHSANSLRHQSHPLQVPQHQSPNSSRKNWIAAVVLGGTSMAGGRGKIIGTLIGALILGFLNNGMNLLGVDAYYQMIVKGAVILLAVLIDNKTTRA